MRLRTVNNVAIGLFLLAAAAIGRRSASTGRQQRRRRSEYIPAKGAPGQILRYLP